MKAADVMTRDVLAIRPDTAVFDALRLMLEHRISGLPVVDAAGAVIGIISEGDFLRRAELATGRQRARWMNWLVSPGRLADEYVAEHGRSVAEVMTPLVVTVDESAPLAEVVELMERRRIKRVPVTRGGKLTGIVTRTDLLRELVRMAPAAANGKSDADVEKAIAAEMHRQPWAPGENVDVRVFHGVAELRGVLIDDRERAALRVLVENTDGVRGVRDLMTTIEPLTGAVIRAAS